MATADAAPSPLPSADPYAVGLLVFPGVEVLDVMGPADVFVVAAQGQRFRVALVAASLDPVETMGGLRLLPSVTFDDAPRFDVVVVPGGNLRAVDAAGLAWLRRASAAATITMSVCMGALILARAGLLDDLEATTHHWGLERLAAFAPRCRVVEGRRFVDAGRIVTTAGVTAGIDGALHVVARLCGEDAARWTADEWLEHPTAGPGPRVPS